MAAIDYYFSTISPWAYLAGDRLERIAARHGASITYRPLDLMQLFDRTGGQRPQDRHPARLALVRVRTRPAAQLLRPAVLRAVGRGDRTAPSRPDDQHRARSGRGLGGR